jgi:SM-20-related protein
VLRLDADPRYASKIRSGASPGVCYTAILEHMPAASFFSKFGFFVIGGFFDHELCTRLRGEIRAGSASAATIGTEGPAFVVDRDVRSVNQVQVDYSSTALVKSRLMGVKPDLESHFGIALADCQRPQFLHYVPGDFYQWHRDGRSDLNASSTSTSRRISAVMFLNSTSVEPRDGMYGGGVLTFYELFDDPVGRSIGFPLEADEGLLVAFRADVPHGVTPVTHGDRYTIASWYV